MATIAKYTASQGLDTDRGGMPQPELSQSMARAVQGLGNSISDLGSLGLRLQEKKKQKDDFKAQANYRSFQLDMGKRLSDYANSDAMTADGEGFHDSFLSSIYRPERDKFLSGLSDEQREKFSVLLNDDGPDSTEWSIKAAERENDQTQTWAKQVIGEGQEALANAISQDPKSYKALLQQGFDEIDSSPLPRSVKMEQRAAWERMAQFAQLNRRLEIDPEGVLKDLGADPRYLSPTSQYDLLERAVTGQESGGNANAISPKGAIGLMQVMPATAIEISKELGDGLLDSGMSSERIKSIMSNDATNRRYGSYYLKKQIRDFGRQGGLEAALIAYNGGPERAKKWIASGFDDSVIPKESADYYKSIMANLPGMGGTGKGDPKSVQLVFNRPKGMAALVGQDESKLNPDLVARVKTTFAGMGLDRVKITSGYRSPADNARVGGAKHSQHQHGNAMDIDVSGYTVNERVQLIQALSANGITGLGIGANIIHADLGGRRAWGYKGPSGGGAVPKWAQAAIDAHLAGKSSMPTRGSGGIASDYASLAYEDRQNFIKKADQVVTDRFNVNSKENAVQRVEMRRSMSNELASLSTTGQTTGFDDTTIAGALGEDDYLKWVRDKDTALRTYTARDGISTMTPQEMSDRLEDYRPNPGSETFADDQKVEAAVQREVDRVTKLRATRPDEAAMQYPDVAQARATVEDGMRNNNLEPEATQAFVRAMLERQKEFGLKPGSEAPVPRDWGIEIGRSLSRIPELAARNRADVNAAIVLQYQELQKVFGDYTEEVILYALSEYKGVGKNTAELITGYMQAIEAGGDPLRLNADPALDRDQVEEVTDDGVWQSIKRTASEFWYGERLPADEADEDPGDPDLEEPPSTEVILRVIGALNGATPEEEADIAARYGQRAYEAAKRRMAAGEQ